jgi:Lysozyme like domain
MTQLSFTQIEQLWVSNGGSAALAPIMAAVALAESGGRTDAHNGNASTGDDSYGLWQINYFGKMLPGRTAQYGSPQQLVADPNLQAKAAISLAGNGSGLSNWTTYTSGAYKAPLQANVSGLIGDSGIQLVSTVAPGQFGVNPLGPDIPQETSEGDWEIGPIFPAGPKIAIPRSGVRKLVGGLVMVGGGVVLLLGTGMVVKTAALQGITSPISKVMKSRSDKAAALQKEQIRQEGLLQRQQERAQERRRDQYEKVDANPESWEPF